MLFALILLLLPASLAAQTKYKSHQTIRPVELNMHLEQPMLAEGIVTLQYTLPYGGVVEVRLLNEEKKILWQNQYINNDGQNKIRFKSKTLSPGTYTIWVLYKGRTEERKLVIAKQG